MNAKIELLRFVFMVVISLWHFKTASEYYMARGYLGVDFYFILSGYFIFNSYNTRKLPPLDYTFRRIRKVYIAFILAFLVSLAVSLSRIVHFEGIEGVMGNIPLLTNRILSELLFLPASGMLNDTNLYNGPAWYLCILFIGGGYLYSLLSYNQKMAVSIIMPILIILTMTFLSLDNHIDNFDRNGPFYMPMWRGIAEMSIGIILSYMIHNKRNLICQYKSVLHCLAIMSFIMMFLSIIGYNIYDSYFVIYASIVILYCMLWPNMGTFPAKLAILAGSISLEMFLIHNVVAFTLRNAIGEKNISNHYIFFSLLYLIMVIIVALLLQKTAKKLHNI